MALIDEIKRAYPKPVAARSYPSDGKDRYCVGGALCRQSGEARATFPSYGQITRALRALNPELDITRADNFAWKIAFSNDERKFRDAWRCAAEALAWSPTK